MSVSSSVQWLDYELMKQRRSAVRFSNTETLSKRQLSRCVRRRASNACNRACDYFVIVDVRADPGLQLGVFMLRKSAKREMFGVLC